MKLEEYGMHTSLGVKYGASTLRRTSRTKSLMNAIVASVSNVVSP